MVILRWCLLTVSVAVLIPESRAQQTDEKAWAAKPKEIAFQNDSQWIDNRWQHTDVGPFLTASIGGGKSSTMKGIAIRVGDKGQAAVCFDTARLRISNAWTGPFLQFDGKRFGLLRPPQIGGETVYYTSKVAGWANAGRFKPEPHEITLPDVEEGYTGKGSSVTHLPKDWAAYKGLYLHDDRVVLSYTVGSSEVLESPWYVEQEDGGAFVRSFEIGPSAVEMQLLVADNDVSVSLISGAGASHSQESGASLSKESGSAVVTIPPHKETVRFKTLIATPQTSNATLQSLVRMAGNTDNLSRWIQSDSPRWPQELATVGSTTETKESYAIDTITIPFENPFNALFFTSGHDFFSDGSAAVCTVHGDVWVVSGIDRDLKNVRWRRYATGLFQPLGLRIVDDLVYVLGRDQITRLHDRNDDGEADWYENFNNDHFVCPRSHDFVTCLDTDPEGNFYFIHAKTGVMKVSSDGANTEMIADGFRNPNGMGVSPTGTITAAPQQGTWTPESSLIVVQKDGYYGFGGPRVTNDRPTGWDLPMCFIPRALDNSGGGQVWTPNDRWGLPAGQMLHLSYGQCRILLALTESAGRQYQGGTIEFPTQPGDFESGIMRGRFSPADGQLYVSGLRGWQTRAIRDGCFQRVRYTGTPATLPVDVETFKNGIQLTFNQTLDREMATNPDNFFVQQWNYLWSGTYGSPEFSVERPKEQGRDDVEVLSATLLDGDRSVFLEMPGRQPVHQLTLNWLLKSSDGDLVRGTYAHTINVEPDSRFDERKIERIERVTRMDPQTESRMAPGLQIHYQMRDRSESDDVVSRMAIVQQSGDKPPTAFLSPGPFDVRATGSLRVPRSGFYEFRIVGTSEVTLSINGQVIATDNASEKTLLSKGHNLLRIDSSDRRSPSDGNVHWELQWRGYDFGWEPVPPDVLFHDSGSADLIAATERRLGRELFAQHRCASCHQTQVGSQPMFEMKLPSPDLVDSAKRFHSDWLAQWILNPAKMRDQITMPAVLAEDEQNVAADIAAFLTSIHVVDAQRKPARPSTSSDGERLDGESLFETLGCISCHRFTAVGDKDDFGRVSLYFANAKYREGQLADFLKRPDAHFGAIRMPDFRLSDEEAWALADFVRKRSNGTIAKSTSQGNPLRGRKWFAERGCQNCHDVGEHVSRAEARLSWSEQSFGKGCLGENVSATENPNYSFSQTQRRALSEFLRRDLSSLDHHVPAETSRRLVARLGCANCHDRDGVRSHRPLVVAEEGSGRLPEVLPTLNWSGEKLRADWTQSILSGERDSKSRPWLKARMPAFPGYATAIAEGLAQEHGVDAQEESRPELDETMVKIGEELTLEKGLDCRQCHAIGDLQPRGDKDTKIALGINFVDIKDRLRREPYHRFMLNPQRFDVNTKMIRLSENGLSTKLKQVFDADARQQFEALWQYIQSLPSRSPNADND